MMSLQHLPIMLKWDELRRHALPFVAIVTFVMAFYLASVTIDPGWVTWSISTFCLTLICITALARVNDIPVSNISARWQVRRLGLIMVAAACVGLAVSPWVSGEPCQWPAWREVMLSVGVMLTWMTTPMMPPWAKYITGHYRRLEVEVADDVRVDIVRSSDDRL